MVLAEPVNRRPGGLPREMRFTTGPVVQIGFSSVEALPSILHNLWVLAVAIPETVFPSSRSEMKHCSTSRAR